MVRRKFLDIRNLSLGLKAAMTSMITGLVYIIPLILISSLIPSSSIAISLIFVISAILAYFYTWGFIGNKLFGISE